MRKITAAQNRKIHMLASQLGMDDDLLHEFVGMLTGKMHISGLSISEAVKVIDGLDGKREYASGSHMSTRQENYIFFLMKQTGWVNDAGEPEIKRLDGFVKKQYGIDSYRFLDRRTASKVIEFLKDMAKRPEKERMQGQA
ncbi:MAG: regulatory protein GemA [Lachnospiraceae bacterium]|nr:regulatory protein GemA [Lachnospiraceae bacterium]